MKAKWSETKQRKTFFHDIYKYLPAPQHGQCACPAFFPYPHLAGPSLPSLPNCQRGGAFQGHHWHHWTWQQLPTSSCFSLPCALLKIFQPGKKLSLGFGKRKNLHSNYKMFLTIRRYQKENGYYSKGCIADWIPLAFPPSFTLFFLNAIIKKSKKNAVTPEVQYCQNRSCSQMIKEKAIFEKLHCNLYLFQIQKGKYLKVRLHSCIYTVKALPLLLKVTVLYLSHGSLKTKWLMPDSLLPFFSGSRKIPTEVTRRNPSDLSMRLNWTFLGLWYSLGQDINPLSHN